MTRDVQTSRYGLLLLVLSILIAEALSAQPSFDLSRVADAAEQRWVDSVFDAMSQEQRLGQLFMLRAHSNLGQEHVAKITDMVKNHQVGGLCFFQGSPEGHVELINKYQALSRTPLLIAIDAEWGLGMRLKEAAVSFPEQLTLGALRDNRLIYEMGEEIARQLKRMGVHVNFAPVVDVNNNPANPVINYRSFGEDRYKVAVKGYMYMKGLQEEGIMACAKHFPGHGDTDVDSHLDLPVVDHPRSRLDSLEMYPFRVLSDQGVGGVMVAHLHVPVLDDRPNRSTTLSRAVVDTLLKRELGFKGLVFTDALDMKGVTKYFEEGQLEAEALLAGNDMLVLPGDLTESIAAIRSYVEGGRLSWAEIDQRVRKILRAKYRLGLSSFKPLSTEGLRGDINTRRSEVIIQRIIREALTLVRNDGKLLPIAELPDIDMSSLSIGAEVTTPFQHRLSSYADMEHYQAGSELSPALQASLIDRLKDKDLVIVGMHGMRPHASQDFGISDSARRFLDKLDAETQVVLVIFGNPYSLRFFDEMETVVVAYEDGAEFQDQAAQAIFGAFAFRGRLPVTASPLSTVNTGISTKPLRRLGYVLPEAVGMNSDTLKRIADIAERVIESKGTPGCVVLVAKDGQIVYHRSFGYHTYRKQRPVSPEDIFDLASITKVTATTAGIMRLYEGGKLSLEDPMGKYLPDLWDTDKAPLEIGDVMAHQSGLKSWMPFYKPTVSKSRRNPRPLNEFYRYRSGGPFTVPVTDRLFMRSDLADSIWQQIVHSELRPRKSYHYSDLGFYLLKRLLEGIADKPLDEFVAEELYRPLGLRTMTFNPKKKFSLADIVPTEEDRYFRRQRIHGYVHDSGAAMLGGVSGHAGLFSNARDLAIFMQMLLQNGYYGGRAHFNPATVRHFTRRYKNSSRRAAGFDMLETDPLREPNLSALASPRAFGHKGFTGTCAWADPEYGLVYVFLSNRTYPRMTNKTLIDLEVRNEIQTVIYNSLEGVTLKQGQDRLYSSGG
ncbi:MAG: glycoside hydrolase family 3 N-terminal domain-containing protein [Saprospiraceae bacterium]|nr:glycoside hydrolase family 3 N-terminal domain-containing protein [Saprospiraceae bacterium]